LEEWTYHETYSGVPQGGVISPVLSNIILNKLDTFVEEELIPQYTQGKHRRANLEYNQLSRKMKQARGEKDLETYRQLEQQRRCIPRGQPNDENFRRLRYCRYADDVRRR
jgi:retron-type reverse transcriptase